MRSKLFWAFVGLYGLINSGLVMAQGLHEQTFNCVMDPAETVRVASPVSGLLSTVEIKRGDYVSKGQTLARLDATVEKSTIDLLRTRASSTAAIDAQKARYELIVKRYARTEKLLNRGIVANKSMEEVSAELVASQSLLRRAELDHAIAQKELARAEAALLLRAIKSPINGVVQDRPLSAGEYVSQDRPVAVVVNMDPLYIDAYLPVDFYEQIMLDNVAFVRPAAPVSGVYEARVTVVDRVFDAASGTFGVRLELPNPNGLLPAGHRCELFFEKPQ